MYSHKFGNSIYVCSEKRLSALINFLIHIFSKKFVVQYIFLYSAKIYIITSGVKKKKIYKIKSSEDE